MSFTTDRIVFSRELSTEEYLSISFFMIGFMQRYEDSDLYYYVEVGENLDLHISSYHAEEIQWQAKELMCTDHEAVVSITEFEGFYEELCEMLWVNHLNGLNRYVAQTAESISEDFTAATCIAKDHKEAFYYFDTILKLPEIITVREDNEETL